MTNIFSLEAAVVIGAVTGIGGRGPRPGQGVNQ